MLHKELNTKKITISQLQVSPALTDKFLKQLEHPSHLLIEHLQEQIALRDQLFEAGAHERIKLLFKK
ncbi:hypothetical protein GOV04_04160 [Candidatus Woesearchaeota archaeon]|nr:hypothetical protein [Candidatus Woesearchaeota archaeon]